MPTKNEAIPVWSIKEKPDWDRTFELLRTGQYEQVAKFLYQAQLLSEQADNAILADILAAALHICWACSQFEAEVTRYRQACAEISRREHDLTQLLQAILDLVSGRGTREQSDAQITGLIPSKHDLAAASGVSPSLLQRLRELLRLGAGTGSAGEKALTSSVITSIEAPFEETTQPIAYAHDPAAAPGVSPTERAEQKRQGAPSLVVYCLGSFRVYLGDKLIANWSGGKGKAIFKYMVANRGRPVAKDVLMDLFWSEADPESARNNLNVAIYALRQAFRAISPNLSCLLFQDDHYCLNPALAVWVDFERFVQCYQAGRNFEKQGQLVEAIREYELAEELYQGDFLEEDLYEDWPILQRESLKDSYLVILERLSRYYLEAKRYTTCVHLCQKILAKDDCREDAHRRLMRCYSRQGQPHLALRQYHLCGEALSQELGVSPAPQTKTLYDQIHKRKTV